VRGVGHGVPDLRDGPAGVVRHQQWRWEAWGRSLMILACLALAFRLAPPDAAAETPAEAHGVADAYVAPGIALAWGVLRDANEAATMVVLRIVTDPQRYPSLAVVGIDPFTRREQPLLQRKSSSGVIDLRVPRAHFADFPRTELRLYHAASAQPSDTPKLVLFYLGVPDTTPEFVNEAKLDAYLAERLARLRAKPGSKTP